MMNRKQHASKGLPKATVIRTPRISLRWCAELLLGLTVHRLNLRYKETLLGFGWILLQPVSLTIIFNYIRRIAQIPVENVPYPLFTATGLISWTLTALIVSQSVQSITGHATLLKRISFPKIILPMSVLTASLVDLGVMTLLLIGLFWYYKMAVPVGAFLVVVPLSVHLCFLLGLSCILSLVVVFLRDIGHASSALLQIWFLASPVFYPSSMVPKEFALLSKWNPMTGLIEGYRSTILFGQLPEMSIFGPAMIISFLVLAIGLFLFAKLEGNLADLL